jgi:hypothetical protein
VREGGIRSFVVIGVAIVSVLAPPAVRAQTPTQAPAQTPPAQTAPAQPATPPEPPHIFSGTLTAGVSLESGQTDLNATQFMLQGQRPYSREGTFTIKAGYTRATTRPPQSPVKITVANRMEANVGIEENFGKRGIYMLRGQALRDTIQQIDYQVAALTGVGVRLNHARAQVRIVPGLAFLSHDKNIQTENGFNVNWGVYQDAKIAVTKLWMFTQYLNYSRDVKDKDDYTLAADASLTGAITKRIGVQLSYRYTFERLLPPGVEPWYQKILAGLQISFGNPQRTP